MKFFFITLPTSLDARNFLVGDFYRMMQTKPDLRLVVFVERNRVEHYRKRFTAKQCIVEEGVDLKFLKRPWRRLLTLVAYSSIPTSTILLRLRYGYLNGGSWWGYTGKRFCWLLGHTPIWRFLLRLVEFHLFRDDKFWDRYFATYQPSAVFATNMLSEEDVSLLKCARRHRVPTLGMVRSWDNLNSKTFIRIIPDLLLVQNSLMVEEAVRLYDVPRGKIRMVGFPQFDHYVDRSWFMEKEELARRFGLDPAKRWIIYFTGGLPSSALGKKDYSDHILMLQDAIARGEIANVQVIARIHPLDDVVLKGDAAKVPILNFGKDFDFSFDDAKLLMNVLRASDVSINLGSTIALELAIFDRPIILAAFDGYHEEKLPWQRKLSVAFDYTVHYLDVQKTGGVWRVNNEKELIEATKAYLKDPSLHHEGRMRLVRDLVGPLDGKAGIRIAEALLSLVR